jgi:heavy metal-binding protein
MNRRAFVLGALALPLLLGQGPVEFICPMDPDVRSAKPGRCPRCGMQLVAGTFDIREYPVSLRLHPEAPRPGEEVQLSFTVGQPEKRSRVKEFELTHERLLHLFIVGQDLEFFRHEHPQLGSDGVFRLTTVFPTSGMYRLLSDFYPRHGTPQLIESTVVVSGGPIAAGTRLIPDLAPKRSANLEASLTLEPTRPIAGLKTLLFFDLNPGAGLERYLGAWGHMLAVSEDLVDMIHNHPFLGDGGPHVQFNLIFPRPVAYRLWVQFQRQGIVNTVRFDVPVSRLG